MSKGGMNLDKALPELKKLVASGLELIQLGYIPVSEKRRIMELAFKSVKTSSNEVDQEAVQQLKKIIFEGSMNKKVRQERIALETTDSLPSSQPREKPTPNAVIHQMTSESGTTTDVSKRRGGGGGGGCVLQ